MKLSRKVEVAVLGIMAGIGCRPSDILDVPPPTGEFTSQAIQGPTAVLQAFYGARSQLAAAIGGGATNGQAYEGGVSNVVGVSGLLTDEFGARDIGGDATTLQPSFSGAINARYVSQNETQGQESQGDLVLENLTGARSALIVAANGLRQYAATADPPAIGENYALIGYAELFMAEDYCAGVPLSNALLNGGWYFGQPLTQDALLAVAEAHFDSALRYAADSVPIQDLASVGLGRTLLDRDSLTAAAQAVANVATDFVYNTQLIDQSQGVVGETDNLYDYAQTQSYGGSVWSVSDSEGENGFPFISSADPRLVLTNTAGETKDGVSGHYPDSVFYLPLKFGVPATGLIPLASGIEARLVQAEADLATGGNWLNDLNALRNNGCRRVEVSDTSCTYGTAQIPAQPYGLQSLTDPGTDSARVRLVFRERAFWLFGTGTRLGDLRRQLRQYGQYWQTSASVFPTGPYGTGVLAGLQGAVQNYGTDVALTLPTASSGVTDANPNYIGCKTPTTQP